MPEISAGEFVELAETAMANARIDEIRAEWLSVYPWMMVGYLKNMSWTEYRDARTGANIDMRPTEVILAEIDKLHSGGN